MRMKKLMILAVTAAIAAVGCNKTFEVTPTTNESHPINFSSWAERLTKATVDGSFNVNDNFKVWGEKVVDATPATVFNGVTVTKTLADPETWESASKQYWDLSATSYTFYGISPAADGYTVNPSTGAVTASPTIEFTGHNNDVLVAQKKVVNKTDGVGNFNNFGKVAMTFNHVAALVDVKVKVSAGLAAAGAHVQVSALELQKISKQGTFTVAGGYTTEPAATWAPAAAAAGTTASFSADANLNTDLDDSGALLINKLVVLPQDFRDAGDFIQKLSIAYNITQGGGSANNFAPDPISLKAFDDIDDTDNLDTHPSGWAPGYHYTYVVTIDAHAIEFTATISNWTTDSAYYYLIN